MEHARQWLCLMQLSSSSLPVGSFTWSQGLEWAVEAGWVTDADAFKRWQIQQMEQSFFCVDLPLFIRLYRACAQNDAVRFAFSERTMPVDDASLAGYVAGHGEPVNLDDAYVTMTSDHLPPRAAWPST